MKVLVAVASKHGSTMGIGEAIAVELRSIGIEVAVRDVTEAKDTGPFDAVVVGSAVYMGRWMPEAVGFVRSQGAALRTMPVWLFSSGPLGDESKPPGDPQRLDELMETAHARGHRIFSGRLDKDRLGLGERLIVKAVHAPTGDFRDWDAIRDWAKEIGEVLLPKVDAAPAVDPTRTAA
jgi:menaquinone-dependent protoporphyrinogen oxidase